MTSRPIAGNGGSTTPAVPAAGPGDRPHLPPVVPAGTSRRSDRKAPLAWLPWLLLGLLALTLLAAALLAKAAGGSAEPTGGSATTSSGAEGPGAAAAAPTSALSAGGQDLLALPGGRVGDLAGEPASGTARVESVVADEGFWVGDGTSRRVFVLLTPEARRSAGESGFQVEAGQTVSLAGTVKPSSAQLATAAGVTDAEGAGQLVEQGGYVEATEIRLAP